MKVEILFYIFGVFGKKEVEKKDEPSKFWLN